MAAVLMRAWIEMPASAGGDVATVLLDVDDFLRLEGRRISIGSHGYAQMWDRPHVMLLHRWIMRVPHGTGYRQLVDHINRQPLDCRKANLRLVTPSESNLNRVIRQRDLPVGVHQVLSGRYVANLKRNRICRYLGTFPTVAEAVSARAEALAELQDQGDP